jgi:hypothetical protein
MAKCDHVYEPPDWKNPAKQEKLKGLYKLNEELFQREIQGIHDEDSEMGTVFKKEWIDELIKNKKYTPPKNDPQPEFIVIGMDTCSGGNGESDLNSSGNSATAIVSFYFTNKAEAVICGAEEFSPSHGDEAFALRLHLLKLAELYPKSQLIFVPENNYGFSSTEIWTEVKSIPQIESKLRIINEGNTARYGISTSKERKRSYLSTVKKFLSQNLICFSPKFFTMYSQGIKTDLDIMDRIILQIRMYNGIILSGKGKGVEKDDLYMAFVMALHEGLQLYEKPVTIEFIKNVDEAFKFIDSVHSKGLTKYSQIPLITMKNRNENELLQKRLQRSVIQK